MKDATCTINTARIQANSELTKSLLSCISFTLFKSAGNLGLIVVTCMADCNNVNNVQLTQRTDDQSRDRGCQNVLTYEERLPEQLCYPEMSNQRLVLNSRSLAVVSVRIYDHGKTSMIQYRKEYHDIVLLGSLFKQFNSIQTRLGQK